MPAEVISIKVLIDADGCPVTKLAVSICRQLQIPCLILCDTAHTFCDSWAQTMVIDKGADSVDFALVSRVAPGDVVITQDYGLASMCLSRNCRVLHQNGWEYTTDNIDALLLERHLSRKHRAAGTRLKGNRKREPEQNRVFETSLRQVLQNTVQGYSPGGSC